MANPRNKIGLVTVLFKSDEVLDGFFKSISIQSYEDYFIYIVDNSPSELTDKLISDLCSKYSINQFIHVKSESNIGVAAGNNVGIQMALRDECEYILILNNDIEFEQPDLFLRFVNEASGNDRLLLIPKILFFDTRKIWMAGGKIELWKPTSSHIGEGDEDHDKYNQRAYFDYAPTCFMLMHKSVFETVGQMDEKYFVYFDDTDFVYRATKQGYRVLYLPNLTVLHKISISTGGRESPFTIYYSNRNRIYFIRKHLRGTLRLTAYMYTFATRVFKVFGCDRDQRKKLIQGIIDGFKIPV